MTYLKLQIDFYKSKVYKMEKVKEKKGCEPKFKKKKKINVTIMPYCATIIIIIRSKVRSGRQNLLNMSTIILIIFTLFFSK